MRSFIVSLFVVIFVGSSVAQEKTYFENPVIRGDIPDPSVIKVGQIYYVTGTSSEWAPFYPVFKSVDLVNWEQVGHVFTEKPAWTSQSFWAPELFYRNGKMYCYYTARRKTDNTSYIGVASAEGTSLKFRDHGPIVEYGTEAIDAFVFDDNGTLYITWKAYGLDKRPIELLGCKLSDDGLRLEGEPFSLLKDDERIGMEGQYHFKHGEYYYIIYSAKSCCGPSSDYDVRVARSKSFKGPYEKYAENPILAGGNGVFLSCGHGTVVAASDTNMYYLSHAYLKGAGFFLGRQLVLHELIMTDDGLVQFKTGKEAVVRQVTPFPNVIQKEIGNFNDDFKDTKLKVGWIWNYPYSDPQIELRNGRLCLSGSPLSDNEFGTVLCLRPQSTSYSYETRVLNFNESFKGLTMYGDNKNLIAFGIENKQIVLKSVTNNTENIVFQAPFGGKRPYLKIEVKEGCLLSFFYSKNGKNWISANRTPIDAAFLVRWDRVARPGLIHIGQKDKPAEMDFFTLKNQTYTR